MAIVDGYVTLAEVKAELRTSKQTDDARLERDIEAASRLIDDLSNHFYGAAVTEARMFTGRGGSVFFPDAQSITLVEHSDDQVAWTGLASSGAYVTNPRPPIRRLQILPLGYSVFQTFVRVTATWGSGAPTMKVKEATLLQAIRFFKRADTPEGVLTGDFGAARLARIDPDVLGLIRPRKRRVLG